MSKFSFDLTDNPRDAGWIPPDERTVEQQRMHEQMLDDTPRVEEVFTSAGSNPDRPRLWQVVAKAIERNLIPSEYLRNGQLKNITQIIGSCVGFGAGNMLLWASLIDALIRGQVERIVVPFVPYHYGKGRQHSGIRGKGSGSIGSGQAKALEVDGYIACDVLDVPKPAFGDAIKWTERIEYDWSDGASIPQKYVEEGRKHTVKSTRVTSTDEAARLADSYYTFTIASSWGGRMQCPIKDGVLLNERVTQWMHQMWCLHGDTKIPLLNGTEANIRDIAETGEPVWVYAYHNGKVVPQRATGFKTRESVPEGMVRVTLDNGESVVTTLDHKFMRRDGSYTEAQHLTPGDSLMPLYRRLSTEADCKHRVGYEMVMDPGDESYRFTHRRVAESVIFLPHETGPTYCLKVPNYHNFAVSAGVFVHNCLDYIDHPRLGRLWWVGNNWAYPHGKDPGGEWDGNTGAPEGGFYITDADLAYILRQNDSFAFADPQGYEDRSRAFDWLMG